jgi:hypothetical protein
VSKPWASGATDEEIIESLREEVNEFSRQMMIEDRRANKAEKQRDALLSLVERYASECGKCGGSGTRQFLAAYFDGDPIITATCEACADIRAAIASAKGEKT